MSNKDVDYSYGVMSASTYWDGKSLSFSSLVQVCIDWPLVEGCVVTRASRMGWLHVVWEDQI